MYKWNKSLCIGRQRKLQVLLAKWWSIWSNQQPSHVIQLKRNMLEKIIWNLTGLTGSMKHFAVGHLSTWHHLCLLMFRWTRYLPRICGFLVGCSPFAKPESCKITGQWLQSPEIAVSKLVWMGEWLLPGSIDQIPYTVDGHPNFKSGTLRTGYINP